MARVHCNCSCNEKFKVNIIEGSFKCPKCGKKYIRRYHAISDTYEIIIKDNKK